MKPQLVAILAVASTMLVGCDDSASLSYPTRADAEADRPFARGWLPQIVPTSSKGITMTNNLDLNISNGAFQFDAFDHDAFVAHLTRTPEDDRDGSAAYSYKGWTFWISPDMSVCKFLMRQSGNEKPSEQNGGGQTATGPDSK
ncbi:MAG: hypothetical protein NTW91_08220 [Verrucomicrobia bacterium]|nr:hypothetical protein [Verrucomicrobiota bacterium]